VRQPEGEEEMFTIMIRDQQNGNERLREDALEVRKEGSTIFVRWSDGVSTPFHEAGKEKPAKRIFVMNRFGATVADYSVTGSAPKEPPQ
jgi:hypothetical protein